MSVHYDSLAINRNIALDLPFREGTGAITHSIARTHPLVTVVGAPGVWTILDSNLPFLTLDGATDYLWASAADTTLLDFTNTDYSVGGWFRFDSGGDDDKTLMSRFLLSNTGWEMYHYTTLTLQMRHHHASNAPGLVRSSAYSHGWAYGNWYFMGFSRLQATQNAIFYRGDVAGNFNALTTICNGGLLNPDSCAVNLNIGRNPINENHYNGGLWRPRWWFERALTEIEWQQIWEKEVEWFRS